MKKKPFVTKEQLEEIVKKYPTPFNAVKFPYFFTAFFMMTA